MVEEETRPANTRNSDIDGTESQEGAGEANGDSVSEVAEDSDIDGGESEEGAGDANALNRKRWRAVLYWRTVGGGVKGSNCAIMGTWKAAASTGRASKDRVAVARPCSAGANNERVLRPGVGVVGKVSGESDLDGRESEEEGGEANALNRKRLRTALY